MPGVNAMKAKVHVTLKPGVLDPQGKAVQHALGSLGFLGVDEVRQGKFIEIDLTEIDAAKAQEHVESMCKQLLANTVIEDYAIEITE
jgi:phosphoribosylformylglycinamidine synthase PurS subunit